MNHVSYDRCVYSTLGCLRLSLGYASSPEWLEPVLWPRTWLCELMWEQQQQQQHGTCLNFYREKKSKHFRPSSSTRVELYLIYCCIIIYLFFTHTSTFSSFWTSRGHRCRRPFFPAVPAFSFYRGSRVQQSHCWSIFHGVLLTHALVLSASQFVQEKKSPRLYIRVCTRRDSNSRIWPRTYTRLEDNLIQQLVRHRGDRLFFFFLSHTFAFHLLDNTQQKYLCYCCSRRFYSLILRAFLFWEVLRVRDKNWRQEPGGRTDDTCDHGLSRREAGKLKCEINNKRNECAWDEGRIARECCARYDVNVSFSDSVLNNLFMVHRNGINYMLDFSKFITFFPLCFGYVHVVCYLDIKPFLPSTPRHSVHPESELIFHPRDTYTRCIFIFYNIQILQYRLWNRE